jgi:hypothetical protein
MLHKTRTELYQVFLEFIAEDIRKENYLASRKLWGVFFWCFLAPVIVSIVILMLVRLRLVPPRLRASLDWVLLIFPVLYSLYILGSEVLIQIPFILKKGGAAVALKQSLKESLWRERVTGSLRHSLGDLQREDWEWIILQFKIDLESMRYRVKYLTALAGAVFFMIMQGIDSIVEAPEESMGWIKIVGPGKMQWFTSNNQVQFVGLGLFLVLLYLSGSQSTRTYKKYLDCLELNLRSSL